MTGKLITRAQIKKAFNLKGVLGDIVASIFIFITGLNRINKLYARVEKHNGRDFTTALLEDLNITFEINEKELEYIPHEGPFIVTSNHPFGAIDGIILMHIFSSVRPDVKFLANFILSHIPNLSNFIVPVNPFTERSNLAGSFVGLRKAVETIKTGGAIALFPAGEVSTHYGSAIIKDKEWQHPVVKMIRNAGVPVVPVYFHGTNSKFFHWIGKIHPILRTLRLPKELLNKRDKKIRICIGRPISVSEISEQKTIENLGNYLRARSYALESNIPMQLKIRERKKVEPIALPKNRKAMQREITALDKNKFLFTTGDFSCYLTDSASIPLVMHELGRRREEAFRAVGEGTGRPLDLDKYDEYYQHLILWDQKHTRLAGAYRIGFGQDIMKAKGVKGFYTQTLFTYEKPFEKILKHSLELGRSFVVLEYQKDALPLMLLIKGLLYSVVKNREVKYLIGPVSISSWYPMFYRSLIVYYIKNNHFAKEFEKDVIPKNPFFPDYLRAIPNFLLSHKMDSVEKLDRYLLRLSNNKYRLPTLVKKYLKLNCKIVSFNVDPDFNYCVDGLILLDVKTIPKQELELLIRGEQEREPLLARFGFTDQGTGS
ncbi:MAG: GNAT family N-acetyltransferase [Bacteroidales bacterium]|nr:GNAT family N-acetyltransferase [Bacteroidales bacterium]